MKLRGFVAMPSECRSTSTFLSPVVFSVQRNNLSFQVLMLKL